MLIVASKARTTEHEEADFQEGSDAGAACEVDKVEDDLVDLR